MLSLEDKLALSTCCCSHRFENGYDMLEWIAKLGFKYAELSHGIGIHLIPGILQAVEDGVIKIASIHNFCPLPMGLTTPSPNLFKPSSKDQAEADLWARYTLETFELAKKVGVDKVVMHSGSAWFFFESPLKKIKNWEDQTKLIAKDFASDASFLKLRDRTLKRVKKASQKHYLRLVDNFSSIFEKAHESNVLLGIENREGLLELPLDADHVSFMEQFSLESPMRYWHDVGHGEIKSQYGLFDHVERLEALRDYLIGFHLHDVTDSGKDHQEIGTGVVDFKKIAAFFNCENQALVLELSPSLSEASILRSKDVLLNII